LPWVLACALAPYARPALARFTQTGATDVVFRIVSPAGVKLSGSVPQCTLWDDARTLTLSVPLAGLTTGAALRDHELRERYLAVQRHPLAVLRAQRADIELPRGDAVLSGFAPGSLSLHGRERPVTIIYHVRRVAGAFEVQGSLRFAPGDYGIAVPPQLEGALVEVVARFAVTGE
jgi:polyisoprenoid-binding protein YceI